LEAFDTLQISTKRDIDDLRRENSSLKLKLSKTLNTLDDTLQDASAMKEKYER
jgi:hypothetical protein